MVKSSPASVGGTGLIPSPGRSHLLAEPNRAHGTTTIEVVNCALEPTTMRSHNHTCALEPTTMKSLHTATRKLPVLTATRESLGSDKDPVHSRVNK